MHNSSHMHIHEKYKRKTKDPCLLFDDLMAHRTQKTTKDKTQSLVSINSSLLKNKNNPITSSHQQSYNNSPVLLSSSYCHTHHIHDKYYTFHHNSSIHHQLDPSIDPSFHPNTHYNQHS